MEVLSRAGCKLFGDLNCVIIIRRSSGSTPDDRLCQYKLKLQRLHLQVLLFKFDKGVIGVYNLVVGHKYLLYGKVAFGFQVIFHLHCLVNQHNVAFLYFVAGLDVDFHDASAHRSSEHFTGNLRGLGDCSGSGGLGRLGFGLGGFCCSLFLAAVAEAFVG